MSRLVDKVCVITGAAGGIGAATADRFEREGAIVVGVDLLEHSVGSLSISADVTSEDAVVSMYAAARERFGRIDVLFNNAGINDPEDGSALEMSLETWSRVQVANLTSVFLCCKHGIPRLLANQPPGGSVINMATFLAVMSALAGARPRNVASALWARVTLGRSVVPVASAAPMAAANTVFR